MIDNQWLSMTNLLSSCNKKCRCSGGCWLDLGLDAAPGLRWVGGWCLWLDVGLCWVVLGDWLICWWTRQHGDIISNQMYIVDWIYIYIYYIVVVQWFFLYIYSMHLIDNYPGVEAGYPIHCYTYIIFFLGCWCSLIGDNVQLYVWSLIVTKLTSKQAFPKPKRCT